MAVLGIFMQSSDTHDLTHPEWQQYFDKISILKSENDSTVVDLNIGLLMGEMLQDFWRYQGSLTTPPCTEGIIWTIFKEPIMFMEKQMKILRHNVNYEDYRGPQPLYNRIVQRSFLYETLSSIPDYNRCLLDSKNDTTVEEFSIFSIIYYINNVFFLLFSISLFISFACYKILNKKIHTL